MKFYTLLACLLLASSILTRAQSHVVINEVLADNKSVLLRDPGSLPSETDPYPDWVELYNPTPSYQYLGGMILTNFGATNGVVKFTFPSSTTLPPNAYLKVFFDDATNYPPFELHTGFALEKTKGDRVTLLDSAGNEIDAVGFGMQVTDLSIGRVPDGSGDWQLTRPTPEGPNVPLTLGAPAQLRINEWMPTNGFSFHDHDDWVEIYNMATNPVRLGGLLLAGDLGLPPATGTFTVISNLSFIDGNGFVLFYGVGKRNTKPYDADEMRPKLSHNTGDSFRILQADTVTPIDTITCVGWSTAVPWVSTNTLGEVDFLSQGRLPDGETNLMYFVKSKSTPGDSNFLPLTNFVFNEILAHTDPPLQDAVELYNPTTNWVDISRFWLSNAKNDPKKYRIPANTYIPPLGYKVFYEYQFNPDWTGTNRSFTFNSANGDSCYIFSASNDVSGTLTGYRKGVDFDSSANGISFGRYTNSAGDVDMAPMSRLSFGSPIYSGLTNIYPATTANSNLFVSYQGASNSYPLVGPVVVTEIMYHPPDIGTNDNSIDEYIELYNMSTNTVRLYDTNSYPDAYTNRWNLNKAVDYTLPYYRTLAPGEFMLIVNFDPATNAAQLYVFRNKYGIPASFTNIYGGYKGKLANSGATIEFRKTDPRQTHGDIGYVPKILVDKVDYNDKAPWPTNNVSGAGPDGGGWALHRVTPELYGNEPTNWISTTPTPGWRNVQFSKVTRANNTVTMNFNGWAGSGYTVQYCQALSSNVSSSVWTRLTNMPPQTNTSTRVVTDTVPPGTKRFYRVVTPMQ